MVKTRTGNNKVNRFHRHCFTVSDVTKESRNSRARDESSLAGFGRLVMQLAAEQAVAVEARLATQKGLARAITGTVEWTVETFSSRLVARKLDSPADSLRAPDMSVPSPTPHPFSFSR
eukprot:190280-Prorocentrum_minimum.AAC.1